MAQMLMAVIAMPAAGSSDELRVDSDFPGGNIILDRIEGDDIYLHQDLRDTEGDWFYWYFRVAGAAGRGLTVYFTKTNVIGTRGPAVSVDGGESWAWLGPEAVDGQTFTCAVPEDAEEVRFCFGIPYLESHLRRFLAKHEADARLRAETLCVSPNGRPVELLLVGNLDGEPQHRVLLTCRHHCCEMAASYELEGVLEAVLADEWMLENVEFLVAPFMDKDGVEDGDQGKNRKPWDHNRDYGGESIYPEVAALREFVPEWTEGKLRVALDLHCPYIRGGNNETIYFVGVPDQQVWANVLEFCEILAKVQTGPLEYRVEDNLPFGQGWNTAPTDSERVSSARWMSSLPGVKVAATVEFPYANAREHDVTPDRARAFGGDLAVAIREYLKGLEAGG